MRLEKKNLAPKNAGIRTFSYLRVVDESGWGILMRWISCVRNWSTGLWPKRSSVEYQYEAYDMFNMMVEEIQEDIVRYVYHVSVVERPQERQDLVENRYDEEEVKKNRGG